MKRLFFVLFLLLLFSLIILAQPQLENNLDNDFRTVSDLAKQIVGWFFAILIVIFGLGATIMNLGRKK